MHGIFLDLANAFGSVPHSLIWKAFDYFRVPVVCTAGFTAGWQRLETGIMAGFTIYPLAFTMAMEIIIRASKWVVGGERHQDGICLTLTRAYMDDMMLVTTTV